MARHSNGKNNYSLSAGAIVVLLVVALAVASAIWYVLGLSLIHI